MKLRLIILTLSVNALACAAYGVPPCSQKMFVKREGGNLYISAKMDAGTDIVYWFKRCMFNELYTFYRVGMTANSDELPTTTPEAEPETVLNLAYSDNIGPFAVAGHGWCGGNHKYMERTARTAFNSGFTIKADGRCLDGDGEMWADRVDVEVENIILDPSRPYRAAGGAEELRDTLCRESVAYTINRNSIEVSAHHRFVNREPLVIAIYYGMQSMFEGETHTFTPAGAYADWTEQSGVSSFTKGDYPRFRRFLEKNPAACQSTFLLEEGLGCHDSLGADDVVFIGNSHGKSYHKLIADKRVENGGETFWRGVYTWFSSPIADDAELLCYEGSIEGSSALFIDCKTACERVLALPARLDARHCEIIYPYGDADIRAAANSALKISADGPGGCILLFREP